MSRMGKAESTYNPLASLPPTSRLLLTSQEGTLCRGHKTGIHLMKTKKKSQGTAKSHPRFLKCVVRRVSGLAMDLIE